MIKVTAPIFTEEYKVIIYMGKLEELVRHGSKYIERTEKDTRELIYKNRGTAFNTLKIGKQPLILINTEYDENTIISTIAHESSHAIDDIAEFINIQDSNGEFQAHGIASVMRHSLKKLKLNKPKEYPRAKAKSYDKSK